MSCPKILEAEGMPFEIPALVCAEGLRAWAWVMMGNEPPEHFGRTMVRVGEYLGCAPTLEGLMTYSREHHRTGEYASPVQIQWQHGGGGMSDEQKIEECPFCKSSSHIKPFAVPFMAPKHYVDCGDPECQLAGPMCYTPVEAIRAWNQMALAFEIARAVALQQAAGEAAWYDENTTQEQHEQSLAVKVDATKELHSLLEQWRQTDG